MALVPNQPVRMNAQERKDLFAFACWSIIVLLIVFCGLWALEPKLTVDFAAFAVFLVATGKAIVSLREAYEKHDTRKFLDLPLSKFWLDLASIGLTYSAIIAIAISSSKVDIEAVSYAVMANMNLTAEEYHQRKILQDKVKELTQDLKVEELELQHLQRMFDCNINQTLQKCRNPS